MNILDFALSSLTFLTFKEKRLLKNNLDSLATLTIMSIEDIEKLVGRRIRTAVWNGAEVARCAEKAALIAERMGIFAVCFDDEAYPPLLREIFDPPYLLFCRGEGIKRGFSSVSVVGTREICATSAKAAFSFAKEAALAGVCVVSGLAYGIDSFAHKGALSVSGAKTYAVLPCGIDTVVPGGNKSLAASIIASGGALLSEYAPGTPAEPWRFVQRNRIIAALSEATVVVQAPPASGALITADFAVGYNRALMLHKACFCDEALLLSKKRVQRLGAKNPKLKRSAEHYREEGAPLIGTFAEYSAALRENAVSDMFNGQQELFAPAY